MKRVRWNERAEDDLFEIGVYTWIYTWTEWGEAQFERYHALLVETCDTIIPQHLKLARPLPGRKGFWLWRCERHVIYFRVVPECLEIMRILHDRMLPENHL